MGAPECGKAETRRTGSGSVPGCSKNKKTVGNTTRPKCRKLRLQNKTECGTHQLSPPNWRETECGKADFERELDNQQLYQAVENYEVCCSILDEVMETVVLNSNKLGLRRVRIQPTENTGTKRKMEKQPSIQVRRKRRKEENFEKERNKMKEWLRNDDGNDVTLKFGCTKNGNGKN